MKELRDYSGAFLPDATYDVFSKEVLLQLLTLCGDYLQRVDGLWYLAVKERLGNDEAFQCDRWVWERLQTWEIDRVTKLLKIEGHDVSSLLKWFQMSPWMRNYKCQVELKNKDRGIATFTHCPTLVALEREGTGREKTICLELEPDIMRLIAVFFNPNMKVKALKLPPRKNKEDIACQWAFEL